LPTGPGRADLRSGALQAIFPASHVCLTCIPASADVFF
jgi:hypothetical protein